MTTLVKQLSDGEELVVTVADLRPGSDPDPHPRNLEDQRTGEEGPRNGGAPQREGACPVDTGLRPQRLVASWEDNQDRAPSPVTAAT